MLVCTLYTIGLDNNSKNSSILRQWADFIEPFDSSFGGYKNSTHIKVETIDCSVFPSSVRASSNFPRWSFVLNNEPIQVNELSPTTITEILDYSMQQSNLNDSNSNDTKSNDSNSNESNSNDSNSNDSNSNDSNSNDTNSDIQNVKFTQEEGFYVKFKDAYIEVGGELYSKLLFDPNNDYELEDLPQYRISSYCENDGISTTESGSENGSENDSDEQDSNEQDSNEQDSNNHGWMNWFGWFN